MNSQAQKHRGARFWDRLAARYAQTPLSHPDVYAHKLERIRAHLKPESRILEFGCGTGSTAITLAPHVAEILATDFSEEMLRIAQGKADEAGIQNISFEHSSVASYTPSQQDFDVVLAMSLLHLLPDWRGAITKAGASLKPGGLFVSSSMCMSEGFAFLRILGPVGRLFGFLPQLAFFTEAKLKAAHRDAGFEIVEEWRPQRKMATFLIARKTA